MKPLDDGGRALAEEALKRAKRIGRRYAQLTPRYAEEIESSAVWGAVRAASGYKPDGNAMWRRWSGMIINGEIKEFLRNSYLKRRTLWPQGDLEAVLDRGGTVGEGESTEALESLLGLLPPRHRELCELVYREGMSPYSAGQAIGVTGGHGCKIHQEALNILRDTLAA